MQVEPGWPVPLFPNILLLHLVLLEGQEATPALSSVCELILPQSSLSGLQSSEVLPAIRKLIYLHLASGASIRITPGWGSHLPIRDSQYAGHSVRPRTAMTHIFTMHLPCKTGTHSSAPEGEDVEAYLTPYTGQVLKKHLREGGRGEERRPGRQLIC